ncbi:hypothetical protein BDV10DRAFT_7880 [Aspergillus recurvatus]
MATTSANRLPKAVYLLKKTGSRRILFFHELDLVMLFFLYNCSWPARKINMQHCLSTQALSLEG